MNLPYLSIQKVIDKSCRCHYEYPPDENGYFDFCGSDEDLFECDGFILCPEHRDGDDEEWDRLKKMLWML
jgi:hypothetical protein